MLTNLLKFFHLIFTLSLLGSTVYCLILTLFKQHNAEIGIYIRQLNHFMLLAGALALVTGTFLVYPKHFTFHTPWIKAAYALVFSFLLGVAWLASNKNRHKSRWLTRGIYFVLLIILSLIVHDAVTKTTFLS